MLPQHVTMPTLPAQALGDPSLRGRGPAAGGRCGGPCVEVLGGPGKGIGKGIGRGQGRPL